MVIKFKRNGQTKAVLKDEASEPKGFEYSNDLEDLEIPEGITSLEEMEEEIENLEGNLE